MEGSGSEIVKSSNRQVTIQFGTAAWLSRRRKLCRKIALSKRAGERLWKQGSVSWKVADWNASCLPVF